MECACQICKVAGERYIHKIEVTETKESLETRINKCQRIKRQQRQFYVQEESVEEVQTAKGTRKEKHFYVMGQDITTQTATESANTLVKWDIPIVLELTNDNADQIEAIFIPESYIPSTKIVSPEEKQEILDLNPTNDKLFGESIANDGEMFEREIEQALRQIYGNAKGGILIIKNIKMLKLDAKRKGNEQEVDFFIVHYANQTIMNIEVKTRLGKIAHLPKEKWPTTKATKQMQSIMVIFADWFKRDLKGKKWKFISFAACQELDPELKKCPKSAFVSEGKKEFIGKVTNINSQQKKKAATVEKHPEDFVTICKYLLYCSPVVALPVGGNLTTVVREAIKKAGSRDNIYIWCYPTPGQRAILSNAKLVFASPFGSGKTLFMVVKAIELANKGEQVLFLIFINADDVPSKAKPLLYYDLEEKFKKHPSIKLEVVFFEDDRNDNLQTIDTEGINHIMVDELFADLHALSQDSQQEFHSFIRGKETVWIALSGQYYGRNRLTESDLEELIKGWFPGFQVAKMSKPLRMPLAMARNLKEQASNRGRVSQLLFNDKLLAESTLPSNLAEGTKIEIGLNKMELIPQVLQQAFETVNGGNVLVIVNDRPYEPVNRIMSQRVQCQCRNKIRVLSIDLAYQCLGRDQGDYHTVAWEHKAEANKPLMDVNRKRDLVVSYELCRGIEHAKIIDTTNTFEARSRSMATCIRVFSNSVLDMEWTIQNLLTKDHECEQITDWDTRREIPSFNMASFIGEIAAKKNFSISKSQPDPLGYFVKKQNPILETLADEGWPEDDLTGLKLRDNIIDVVSDDNRIGWPSGFGFITKVDWIKNMEQNPTYYMFKTSYADEFAAHERLLLELASKFLKRRVCLVPFFAEDTHIETFEPPNPGSSRTYYLLGCNMAYNDNFFVSIVPNEPEVKTSPNRSKNVRKRNWNWTWSDSNFLGNQIERK